VAAVFGDLYTFLTSDALIVRPMQCQCQLLPAEICSAWCQLLNWIIIESMHELGILLGLQLDNK